MFISSGWNVHLIVYGGEVVKDGVESILPAVLVGLEDERRYDLSPQQITEADRDAPGPEVQRQRVRAECDAADLHDQNLSIKPNGKKGESEKERRQRKINIKQN